MILIFIAIFGSSVWAGDLSYKNVDPDSISFREYEVPNKILGAATERFLDISIKGESIGPDSFAYEFDSDAKLSTADKKAYFMKVLDIARAHGSKLQVYRGKNGYKWIEPMKPEAQKEVNLLMSWDQVPASKIDSVSRDFVHIQGKCPENFSFIKYKGSVRVLIMGTVYKDIKNFKNKAECDDHKKFLESQINENFVQISDANPSIKIVSIKPVPAAASPASQPSAQSPQSGQ